MPLTDDPHSACLHEMDENGMQHCYLVLSDEERAEGFVRQVRESYIHAEDLGGCGTVTWMARPIAETYARQPNFYGGTYCAGCRTHFPVGPNGQFYWSNGNTGEKVGT